MSVGSEPDGGVLVGPIIAPTIYRAMTEISPFRGLARHISMTSGDAWETPQDGGAAVAANWVGESESRPVTASPRLENLRVPTYEIYAMPGLSQELLDDNSFDAEGFVQTKIAESFAAKFGAAYIVGDGVAMPRGLTTYSTAATADATRAWGTIQHVATGTSGGFTTSGGANGAEVFVDAIAALKAAYRQNAKWIRVDNADRPIAAMQREHVRRQVAARAEKAASANALLKSPSGIIGRSGRAFSA